MDFIFQSGEFINEGSSIMDFIFNFIIEIFGAGIGAFIAILIFVTGYKRDRINEQQRQEDELFDYIFVFQNLLKYSTDEQDKQNVKYKEYVGKSKEKLGLQLKPAHRIPLKNILRIIKFIDDPSFLNSFLAVYNVEKKEVIESYRKLCAGIDFLPGGNEQITSIVDSAMKNDYQRRVLYNKESEVALNSLREVSIRWVEGFNKVNEIFEEINESGKLKNTIEHQEKFVEPILSELDILIKKGIKLEIIKDKLISLIQINDEIKYHNDVVLNLIEDKISDLVGTNKVLVEELKKFSDNLREKVEHKLPGNWMSRILWN